MGAFQYTLHEAGMMGSPWVATIAHRGLRWAVLCVFALSFTGSLQVFAQATSPAGAVPSVPPAASGPPKMAVIPFASAGASPEQVSAATDRLGEELVRIGKIPLVDQGPVNAAYKDQLTQPGACVSVQCAAGIGWSLGAQQVVTGKITRLDDTQWLVSAQVVTAETVQTVRAESIQYAGSFFDLLREGMPFMAARLSGGSPSMSRALARRLTETSVAEPAKQESTAPTATPASTRSEGSRKGFGIFTGFAQFNGTVHAKSGGDLSYSGGGLPSIGVDYQFDVSDPRLSLDMFFTLGAATVSGGMSRYYDAVGGDALGAELRYWWDRWFVGGRGAIGTVVFIDNSNGRNNSDFAAGGYSIGASGGYDAPTGAFVTAAFDYGAYSTTQSVNVRTDANSPRAPLQGSVDAYVLWLNVGYRWK